MPNRRTRERQLSKVAARRAAERRRKQRQRTLALAIGAGLTLLLVGFGLFLLFRGREQKVTARPTPTGATATPTVSSSATPSAGGVACGAKAPKNAGDKKRTYSKPPPMRIDSSKSYTATVDTSCGTLQIELFAEQAPVTVNSFIFLAQQGFYDGLTFHRIAQNPAVIQGGDPKGDGTGGPGYTIKEELDNQLEYEIGTLAMAKTAAPHSTGSQFFIVTGESGTQLPKQYTIFGKVSEGMDVVKKISALPVGGPSGESPTQKVYIDEVTIRRE